MLDEASRQSLLYLRYLTACHFASSQASTQDPVWIAVDPTVKPWFLRRGRVTGQDPKDRTAVSATVKEMLRARHLSNKRRSWTGGSIKLNAEEKAAVNSTCEWQCGV